MGEKNSLSCWGELLPESKSPHRSTLGDPWPCLGVMAAQLGTSVEHAAAAAAQPAHKTEREIGRRKSVHSSHRPYRLRGRLVGDQRMPCRATPSAPQLWHVFASLPQLRHATDSPWSSSSFWMPNRAVVAAAVLCAAPSACHRLGAASSGHGPYAP